MTVVTGISLYSDVSVISVIAVISYELDESTLPCPLSAVLDSGRLKHLAGKLSQVLRHHIGRSFRFRHISDQFGGCANPFGTGFHKLHYPKKETRNLRFVNLLTVFSFYKLPHKIVKL
jgi:hypothetical protein